MALPVTKFGQYVILTVHNGSGELVFETDSLRVDFDVRHIDGWSRAKVTIFNLAGATIKRLSGGDNYVTVKTALHDSEITTVIDRMYVSNALEEKKVPQGEFNMYCYSKLRKLFLENQIDTSVSGRPTLRETIKACVRDANYTGVTEFKHFPSELLDFRPPKNRTRQQGSLISVLACIGRENSFNTYTDGNKIVFMYKPVSQNVADTDFYTSLGDIKLATTNMRADPKIGPATLSVVSNLDPRIKPSTVLDISELLTLGTNTSQTTLEVAEGFLRESVAGFSKYQTISVQHKGSNWTATWLTQIAATSPTPGTTMATNNWWS